MENDGKRTFVALCQACDTLATQAGTLKDPQLS